MKTILLAEDDLDFGAILKQYLELSGFIVYWYRNGKEALISYSETQYDICILDIMMPIMDGFTLAENILKKNSSQAFLFLTAKNLKEDRILGLKIGADDYITKPCEADELVLRIHNILKRIHKSDSKIEDLFFIGNYQLDITNFKLISPKKLINLTEKETSIIQYLAQHPNQLIKREDILQAIWLNKDYFSGRSMDVFLSKIRKYFAEDHRIQLISYRNLGIEFKIP
ncbi:response regulator transcription factor [Flavobacterium oreochromis]|uniref:Response regulator transcription factor n=1 Tax=Flavobacterium oreochromis TaxID=2906078 RepID=A0ABW8PBC8_9FLAO|nr:response regulator transcription factor [Flavobacterium oreochromis]OWP75657.1 DNA-binding response regulator [Flavobacterium oreochromis]POR21010.1 DNA-binding response regulator [Flavobacterium columnare]